jgi:hypothetical protein
MRCRHWRYVLPLLFVAMGTAGTGCSGSSDNLPREPISGTVTLDGQPLAGGTIEFTPSAGAAGPGEGASGGSPISGGKFSIERDKGLVPGKYRVVVHAASAAAAGAPKAEPGGRPKASDRPKEIIPAKYNAESTLTAEVKKGGPTEFKFDLVSQ